MDRRWLNGVQLTLDTINKSLSSSPVDSDFLFYLKKVLETDGFDVDGCDVTKFRGDDVVRPQRHKFKRDKRLRNNCRLALQHLIQQNQDYKDSKLVLVSILKYNYQGGYHMRDYLTFKAKDLSTQKTHIFQTVVGSWPIKKKTTVHLCRPEVVKDDASRSGKVFGLGQKKEVVKDSHEVEAKVLNYSHKVEADSLKDSPMVEAEVVKDSPKVEGEVVKDSPKVAGEVLKDSPKVKVEALKDSPKKEGDDSVHTTYMKTRSGKAFGLEFISECKSLKKLIA